MDWNHAVKLGFDLFDHRRSSSGYDGDTGQMALVVGFGNCQAVDVIATAGKQADDAGQHASLVINDHG